jgi:hypothetical protein
MFISVFEYEARVALLREIEMFLVPQNLTHLVIILQMFVIDQHSLNVKLD